ncbi:hypothetical protein PHYBLDRAFT_161804 [Phycomyces blakesleeanus NRRL 1555(-)]|uniref:Uncharacterized protein n=1 Tax=Phycomyces blakesleeanus (strain ATCC 8743b / DSM 1359 / FGSC 10004 / NBRC 33097 / NRRL 1555) TaxID=763407 RepID=A0A167R9S8_PHYB8|nr:hypothetical protein PHYBLDRAFT_161804 [Phycomyces blakesleeanus NRRL 1555(-)]OAD81178.1 hypothetical protein PHYBLDRAFT_161804 [Phycomyces blakesleeanus NRRL 1555(-)]|eukprot:XP_018299218.1 hypothetical protein PHYBLDRAFT_161804 [Phycomyces blakesleeanus NRRL 1555(-)]
MSSSLLHVAITLQKLYNFIMGKLSKTKETILSLEVVDMLYLPNIVTEDISDSTNNTCVDSNETDNADQNINVNAIKYFLSLSLFHSVAILENYLETYVEPNFSWEHPTT